MAFQTFLAHYVKLKEGQVSKVLIIKVFTSPPHFTNPSKWLQEVEVLLLLHLYS